MTRKLGLLAVALVSLAGLVSAEEAPGPPGVLVIRREEIKPGKMVAHEKSAAGFLAVQNRIGSKAHRLALLPVSGDDNVVVYFEPYPDFATFEATNQEFDQAIATNAAVRAEMEALDRLGDVHASQRSAIYRLRADLSYRPRRMEDVAKARYFSVTTTRVKPGRGPDYVDYLKTLNEARTKAEADIHTTIYQVVSGAPFGTFLSITSLRSLNEVDDGFAKMDATNKAVDAALGGDEAAKKRRALFAELVAEGTNTLYRIDPSISRPPDQLAALDPDFWKPKPATAPGKALAVKKQTAKTPENK